MNIKKIIKKISVLDKKLLINFSIRLLVMLTKYFVILLAYENLIKEDFVHFSIIFSFINFSVLLVGLDLYQISQRLHINFNKEESSNIFFTEITVGFLFVLLIFILSLTFLNDLVYSLSSVIFITFFDYFLLTTSRFFLIKKSFLSSTILNGLRALPLLLIIFIFLFLKDNISLIEIINIWLGSICFISIVTFLILTKYYIIISLPNIRCINKLLNKNSIFYWLCSLSTYLYFFVDKKILISLEMDFKVIATYSYFFSLFSFIPAIIESFIVTPNFTKILQLKDNIEFEIQYESLMKNTLNLILLSLVSIFPIILFILHHNAPLNHGWKYLFAPLILFINHSIGYIPSTFLYAKHNDISFFKSHLYQFIVVITIVFLSFIFKSYNLFIIGFTLSFLILMICKHYFFKKINRPNDYLLL